MGLEPVNYARVDAKGQLLLDGAEKYTSAGAGPIPLLRDVARVDLIVGQCREGSEFGLLIWRDCARIFLLHRLSFHAMSRRVRR